MSKLLSAIEKAETIAIGGHVRPDGDCIGSCMGLFRYIKKNYPDKQVCVYVEEIPDAFDYLKEEDAFYEKSPMTCLFPLTAEMRSVLVMHKR